MPVISFDRVSKRYGHTNAVRELSLSIRGGGEMFGLIGPDGAGKTTTIRLMCGLLAARWRLDTSARSRPRARPSRMTASVGYLSQPLQPLRRFLSIDENIAFFAEIHGVRDYRARSRSPCSRLTQLTPLPDAAGRPAVGRH